MCLFLCQYQTVLITVAFKYCLMSGMVIPLTLFFVKIARAALFWPIRTVPF